MKQYFLLDLDGTIADNGEGILKSAQYALDAFGIHNQPEAKLRQFVGPPLDESFRELYGFSQEQALEAVKKYGFLKGTYLATKRLLKCHPFHKGGYDPVP